MHVERIRALRGPNRWTRSRAIEAIVRCDAAERELAAIPRFAERLRERCPDLVRLPNGASTPRSMAHALGAAAFALQSRAGCPISFARTIQTSETGVYQVVVEYSEEAVGRLAFELAEALVVAVQADSPFDTAAAVARLRAIDEDERLGPSTGEIVQAARTRGIPYRRLTTGSLVQLGWGSRQRRIQAAEMDATSAVAEQIAQDKELTKQLLSDSGIPVPDGVPVETIDEAWAAMQRLGSAVVVKPRDGNQGKGVTVNVRTREQLEAAWAGALEFESDLLVERYIPGSDFRLLVVGGQLVAAARRDPPAVIGNGVHTIRELVDEINRDPRRSEGHATALTRVTLDTVACTRLAGLGLSPESVPAPGVRVVLRHNANLSTGGSATDVTDDVHPEVAARAIEAARTVGLDICGVDIVCENISRPLEEQGGGIVEVNAAPGLRMHIAPSYGKGRAIGEAVMAAMFEADDDARIPVVAVTGTNGKTTTVRLIAQLLAETGARVGMTTTDGVYVNGRRTDDGDCSGPKSARNVLLHPHIDAAVFETARGGLLREGLGFDRCRVAVVTNIGEGDHLGMNHVDDVATLAEVKSVVVQNVSIDGFAVLNADDERVAAMAQSCPGAVIFFAREATNPVLAAHRAHGERVVYRDGDEIACVHRGVEHRIALEDAALTRHGTIGFQVENAMAAIGAAWALGLEWSAVRTALRRFVPDARTAPGRFNVFEHAGATVIADYGHNVDAIAALVQAVESIPATRRSIVISGAGDRRDEDLRAQTRLLGEAFDEVILYEDQCQRGRADGEVVALLREGLQAASRTSAVRAVHGEFPAIDAALDALAPGELCVILVDQVEAALAHIERRITPAAQAAPAPAA
ncbi:MAG: cyanophycin synthetase [Burkholderiaceae bacterium]|nr:cyanophycin synthetase [Burkholderiaceae bacterium]